MTPKKSTTNSKQKKAKKMKVASAHTSRKVKADFKHNDRTNLNHKNINKELVHLNECDYTAEQVKSKITELYAQSKQDFYNYCAEKNGIAKRTKKPKGFHNFTKKGNCVKEFIIECNEHTTMEQLKELSSRIAELTKFTPLQIALHRDEGHQKGGKFITHYHAHISFYTLEQGTGLQLARAEATLSDANLSKIQTLTAVCLNMQRGARNYESGQEQKKYIADYREYKAIQENKKEALQKIEFERELLEQTNRVLNAKEADLKREKKENDEIHLKRINELSMGKESVLNDISEKYDKQKSFIKNILTFGKHNKRIEADKYTAQMGFLSAFDKEKKKLESEHAREKERLEQETQSLQEQKNGLEFRLTKLSKDYNSLKENYAVVRDRASRYAEILKQHAPQKLLEKVAPELHKQILNEQLKQVQTKTQSQGYTR